MLDSPLFLCGILYNQLYFPASGFLAEIVKIMDLEEFIVKFANQFDDTDTSEIQASTEYQELEEWSSLTAMSIIALAKTEYGKTITGREVRSCKTVGQLFTLISSK